MFIITLISGASDMSSVGGFRLIYNSVLYSITTVLITSLTCSDSCTSTFSLRHRPSTVASYSYRPVWYGTVPQSTMTKVISDFKRSSNSSNWKVFQVFGICRVLGMHVMEKDW